MSSSPSSPSPSSPFALAAEAAAAIADRTGTRHHDVAIVLGSGWRPAADRLGSVQASVSVSDLPGFPASTVPGHGGSVQSILGPGDRHLLVFVGRVHGYEGNSPSAVVHGVRTAAAAGCRTLVVTNAAGGIGHGMQVGQPVLLSDHINLTGQSPLTGVLPEDVPSRFVDLTEAYSPHLRALAREVDSSLVEGVYAALSGPQYETPAEIRMLRGFGADLVGMSTVWETIAARHLGLEVLGLSLVTNLAAGLGASTLSHDEVLTAGRVAAERMGDLLAQVVSRL